MKNKLEKNWKYIFEEYIIFFILLLLFAYPVLPHFIQSISIVCFLLGSIISYKLNNKVENKIEKRDFNKFLIITIWILFLLLTLLYSSDLSTGLKIGLRYLNLIIIPLAFILMSKTILAKKKFLYLSFISANLIFILIIYYKAIIVVENSCFPEIYYQDFIDKLRFILNKPNHVIFSCFEIESEHSFFIHRVYNSMNNLFSILLLIELIFETKNRKWFKAFGLICMFVFLFQIYFQFSVVNVALTIIVVPLFIMLKISKEKRKKFLLIGTVFVMGISLYALISQYEYKNNVVFKELNPVVNLIKKVIINQESGHLDERYELNRANIDLFLEKPIFGYGIGDVQENLNIYYYEHINQSETYQLAFYEQLNSHNNYAFVLLAGGILLFILFLISFVYQFHLALKTRNLVYIFLILIFCINLSSENILLRIHGVLFFALFSGLFLKDSILLKKRHE